MQTNTQNLIVDAGGINAFITPGATSNSDIFGTINPPTGVDKYDVAGGGLGLMVFISNMIRLVTVMAGIWVMFNFISAGWTYITSSGNANAHKDVANKLTMSMIGILLIVGAYTIAALIGLIVFGDATYIINPVITGI